MNGWTGRRKEEGKDGGGEGGIMWRSESALKNIGEQSRVGRCGGRTSGFVTACLQIGSRGRAQTRLRL